MHWSHFLILSTTLSSAACAQSLPSSAHLAALDAAVSVAPADPAEPATPLTIEQALELAEKNNPLLTESAAIRARAQAAVRTSKAYTNPTVEFLGGDQSARAVSNPGVPGAFTHYGAGQTIEVPSERRARIHAAQLELTGAGHQFESVRLAVAARVRRAFYDVLRRKQQLANAHDNLALVEDLRRRVGMEVQVGEKGKLELTRAEAELARARAVVRGADAQLANARAMLKAVLGASADSNYDPQGKPAEGRTLPPLADLRAQVLEHHPALAEAASRTTQAETLVERERARRIPEPTFQGFYERQPDVTLWQVGVSVPLPLWDRRKGPIGEAQAESRRWNAVTQQRKLELTAALESAYDQYEISDQQVQGLEAGSLREAQAAVDAARSAYRFGERGILEVLDAQRVLQGVRSDLLDALYARQTALIDLEELGAMQP